MARSANRFNAIGIENKTNEVKEKEKLKVALYARISVENPNRDSESIENQIDIMKRYINDRPEFSNYREYVDRAYTGTNFDRPAFRQMIDDINAGRINCIIVKDLSRFGRNDLEISRYIGIVFPFQGVRFISINDNFDTGCKYNGNKELEVALKNIVNDMYAKDISTKVSSIKRQSAEMGNFMGSLAPYGYSIDKDSPKRQLIINPATAEIVKNIFDMALRGLSLREISKWLQHNRISIPRIYAKTGKLKQEHAGDESFWRTGTIATMLKNEAYIGNLVQGRRRTNLLTGEKAAKTSPEEWVRIENTHEPIISNEVFNKVASLHKEKIKKSSFFVDEKAMPPKSENRYAKILFCGECGKPMYFSSEIKLGKRKYFYVCANTYRITKESCKTRITEKALDKVVSASLTAVYKSEIRKAEGRDIGRIYTEAIEREEKKYIARKKKIISRINLLESKQAVEYERFVTGYTDRNSFENVKENIEQECLTLEEDLNILTESFDELKRIVKHRKRWSDFLSDAVGDDKISAQLLSVLIKRIEVYPGHKLKITYNFENPKGV